MAFASRSELVADKLRHLLPGSVAGQLIISILRDTKTDAKLREKVGSISLWHSSSFNALTSHSSTLSQALQLANVKLISDGGFSRDGEENDRHLNELATTLNGWIVPARVAEKVWEEIILTGLFSSSR